MLMYVLHIIRSSRPPLPEAALSRVVSSFRCTRTFIQRTPDAMTTIRRLILWSSLLLTTPALRAQVFIPDTLVRAWLNQSIPGIVDANGIMDTTHAGIAGCDSAMWYGSDNDPDTVQIDLEGVQYLHALTYLFVSYYSLNQNKYTIQSLPELPPALNRLDLSIHIGSGHVHLPVIDHPMDDINIQGGPMNRISVHFDAILDTLARIDIHAYDSISCDQFSGYVEDLNLHANDLSDDSTWISLTNWKCDWLYIDGNLLGTIFDLDECEANDLYITDCNVIVQSWPLGLTDLTIHGYTFHPIPSFPSTIQSMNLQVFPSICLPMLPEGLMSLSGSSGVNCIPNIPTSMQYMDGPFIWQNPGDTILCSILNSDCPGAAAAIAGRHAIDDNSNGQLDAGEPLFPWGRVLIQPMNAQVPATAGGSAAHSPAPTPSSPTAPTPTSSARPRPSTAPPSPPWARWTAPTTSPTSCCPG